MPVFYFHISSGDYCSFDDVGVNLSDLGEAHWYAQKLIFKLRAHLSREDAGGWIIKVTDESGTMRLAVLASSVPWNAAAPSRRQVFGRRWQDVKANSQEAPRPRRNVATEDGPA